MRNSSDSNLTEAPQLSARPGVRRVPLYAGEPQTLGEVFEHAVNKHARPEALNYKRDGRWQSISSTQLIERVRHIALGLYSLGIRKGERIALLSANSPEWTLADAACVYSGLINVPIYATQSPNQVRYILINSNARILLIQSIEAFERIVGEVSDVYSVEYLVFLNGEKISALNTLTLVELEERGAALESREPALIDELKSGVEPEDLATIIYTSGTTGIPKGVMLTHRNLVSNLIDSSEHFLFSMSDVALSALPLSHIFERLLMYSYIYFGVCVYYAESIERIGANLLEVRPTIMTGVPRMFEKIFEEIRNKAAEGGNSRVELFNWSVGIAAKWAQRKQEKQKLSILLSLGHTLVSRLVFKKWRQVVGGRLRFFISGGAALPETIGYIFNGAGLVIAQGYGLTETSPVVTANPPNALRTSTVGLPIRNVEVRIAEDSEILVHGPNVMRGYYQQPQETAEAFTEDGWFKTGDIGQIDKDGYLKITDRKKEMFKTSGGKFIAPQVLEGLIKTSRFVSQVVIVGNARKYPAALIVPNWQQLVSYAKLKGFVVSSRAAMCRHPLILDLFNRQIEARMANQAQYEKVKRFILLEHEFSVEGGELTPTLKAKRAVIHEKYKDLIDRLYDDNLKLTDNISLK